MDKIAIVIPCYNEANRLSIGEFQKYTASRGANKHFIFVNDGSTDTTFKVLNKLVENMPDMGSVLDLPQNVGKAEAVRQGIQFAFKDPTFKYVGFWDADLATPLDAIDEFYEVLQKTPAIQVVMGARCKLLGRNVHRKLSRHYLGRVFATVVSMLLDLGVYDTQCGAKLFRSNETIRSLFNEKFSSKWIFDVEIIARFIQSRGVSEVEASIYEYPLKKWQHIEGSKVKFGDFVRAFFELLGIHRQYLKGLRKPQ